MPTFHDAACRHFMPSARTFRPQYMPPPHLPRHTFDLPAARTRLRAGTHLTTYPVYTPCLILLTGRLDGPCDDLRVGTWF